MSGIFPEISYKILSHFADQVTMKHWKFHFIYLSISCCAFVAGFKLASENVSVVNRAPASFAKKILGSAEMVSIGDERFLSMKAKVDSGAETSSLHAKNIHAFQKVVNGKIKTFISFTTQNDEGVEIDLLREVLKVEEVKSASGATNRYFIEETVSVGESSFKVEVNLADRTHLTSKFLIGKNVLKKGGYLIDVDSEHLETNKIDF